MLYSLLPFHCVISFQHFGWELDQNTAYRVGDISIVTSRTRSIGIGFTLKKILHVHCTCGSTKVSSIFWYWDLVVDFWMFLWKVDWSFRVDDVQYILIDCMICCWYPTTLFAHICPPMPQRVRIASSRKNIKMFSAVVATLITQVLISCQAS